MKKLLTIITLFIISACATQESNKITNEKYYSDSTEREFNRIEKGLPEVTPPVSPVASPIKNNFSIETHRDGSDDRLNELNQNLNIYCMKSSRKKRFRNEKACHEFVQKSLRSCEKNHRIVNRSLINCVKNKLNLK